MKFTTVAILICALSAVFSSFDNVMKKLKARILWYDFKFQVGKINIDDKLYNYK